MTEFAHELPSDARLPRVLLIPDVPGWALDHKARNLQRALAGRYEFACRYEHEVSAADFEAADLVLVFYWMEFVAMKLPESVLAAHRDRLLIGICGHNELEGEWRRPGMAILERLPCAIFAA